MTEIKHTKKNLIPILYIQCIFAHMCLLEGFLKWEKKRNTLIWETLEWIECYHHMSIWNFYKCIKYSSA